MIALVGKGGLSDDFIYKTTYCIKSNYDFSQIKFMSNSRIFNQIKGKNMKHNSIILLILVLSMSLAQAQYKPDSGLLIFNVGFTKASPEDLDADLHGNTFSLSYEKSDYRGRLAAGIAIAYSTTSADSQTTSGQNAPRLNSVSYEVLPIMIFGKVLFGSPKLKGYIGAGFGIHFSNVKYFTQNVQVTGLDSGFLIGGLAGLNFFLSEKILLNAHYSLHYLNNGYYQNNLAHNLSIGLGFQFY